jgi:hypothetical protein
VAIPPNAEAIPQTFGPVDILDFSVIITRGDGSAKPPPFLLTDEAVASFTLALSAEAVAAGLFVKQGVGYPAPTFADLTCTFWLAVAPEMQGAVMFQGTGATFGIELTVVTTAQPPRTKQRTLTVKVAKQ